jgi:hypothetical protein
LISGLNDTESSHNQQSGLVPGSGQTDTQTNSDQAATNTTHTLANLDVPLGSGACTLGIMPH